MICFKNKGELDVIAAMTFGVSAKESNDAFGQFGTGLKYAVAILLRTGHEVTIVSGEQVFDFKLEAIDFRGKEFHAVLINNERSGFTTHLGAHWEVWQAYRELVCNAMDEPDYATLEVDDIYPCMGHTQVFVAGQPIENVHVHSSQYFLFGEVPKYVLANGVEVYDRPLQVPGIYVKGVRVDVEEHAEYSYNFTKGHPDLTEDRTIKYSYEAPSLIGRAIARSTDEAAILDLTTDDTDGSENLFEYRLEYGYSMTDEFKEVAAKIYNNPKAIPYRGMNTVYSRLGLDERPLVAYSPSQLECRMMEKALAFLNEVDLPITHRIDLVEELGKGQMAIAMIKERKIILAKQCFNQGTRYVASTLLEEQMHIDTGYDDCTRELQTHLFDLVIKLSERLLGEPL